MSRPHQAPGYLWLDAEFSSLELEEAEILQVALMATDANLKRLAPPEKDLVLFIKRDNDRGISPWVKEHIPHIVRGCLGPKAVTLEDAEVRLCSYIDRVMGPIQELPGQRPLIAGNSVHNDWYLFRRLLPGILRRSHYRLLDVSTLKTQWTDFWDQPLPPKEDPAFIKRYFPEANLREDMGQHDAYFDIQASVAELAFYREKLDLKSKI
ncbi:exonuclease domain-containing protein [Kiritimatiellaeota bacterium B1221]|nr:exonuclease domain-containing protein [Kiritimatiellaeota bacterium B1221]